MGFGDIVNDFYKATVPTNARAYIKGLSGSTTPIDENYFTKEEIKKLRAVARMGKERVRTKNEELRLLNHHRALDNEKARNDPNEFVALKADPVTNELFPYYPEPLPLKRDSITYQDYDDLDTKRDLFRLPITTKIKDPLAIAHTTIGRALLEDDADGNTILNDQYKFNTFESTAPEMAGTAEKAIANGNLYGALRMLGGLVLPEGTGFSARLNLGKLDEKEDDELSKAYLEDKADGPSSWVSKEGYGANASIDLGALSSNAPFFEYIEDHRKKTSWEETFGTLSSKLRR